MKFRTSVPITQQEPKIDHTSKILLLGSCFVENIGEKLDYYQFQNLRNPFGIFYHPEAIGNFIKKVAEAYVYEEKDIFFHNEQWHCFDAHSCMNASNKEELLFNLNGALQHTRVFLETATHIVFTFGTSWHYKELKSGHSVANCHKLSQKNFNKEILNVKKIKDIINSTLQCLLTINPDIQIIFTVSPVRHLKDGFVENQQSKAHLITSIHLFLAAQKFKNISGCFYFPAYEIMLDELRDYRFYADDMLHPSSLAIDHIWAHFTEVWMDKKALELFKSIEIIHKGLAHKAFNKNSEKHQLFLEDLDKKILSLKNKIPTLRF